MRIDKVCCYKATNYNLLPAVLLTPKEDGCIVAFKWWDRHLGFYFVINSMEKLTHV